MRRPGRFIELSAVDIPDQFDRAQVRYREVMAHVNWAVIAIQQADRHVSGEENSLLLALTGHIVPELEWEILNMTEQN